MSPGTEKLSRSLIATNIRLLLTLASPRDRPTEEAFPQHSLRRNEQSEEFFPPCKSEEILF
jgi:hypothetical protein